MPISSPTTPVSAGAGTSSMRQRSQSVPLPKKSVRFLPTETKGLVAERQLDSDQGVDDIDCPIDTWLNHVGRGWGAQYGTAFHQVAVHSVRDLEALLPDGWAILELELENCGAKFVQFRRLVEAMERIPEFDVGPQLLPATMHHDLASGAGPSCTSSVMFDGMGASQLAERQLDSDHGVDDIDCPIDTWLNHVGRGWGAQYGTAFHQVAVHSVRDLEALLPDGWAILELELENCGAKFVQFRRLVEAMERIPEFHGMDFCQLPQHTVPVNRVESPTFRGIPEGLPDIQGPLSPSSGRRRRPVRSWLSTI